MATCLAAEERQLFQQPGRRERGGCVYAPRPMCAVGRRSSGAVDLPIRATADAGGRSTTELRVLVAGSLLGQMLITCSRWC